MGSKTQTQTAQQSTTPINQGALQNIYNQVQSAAQTPYTPYSGQLTAPVNAQQTAGINNINANANFASPYIQQAAGMVSGAANPLTAAQIQQYQNPYTQNVVNATQAQFNNQNAEQQNSLKGTAAQQGALGGDRQAVAQAQLAGQQQIAQAPTIANLYSNSYNSGLQTAGQQFQQNPLAAASSIGNLGVAGQNAALQGAGAQINAGTLQQQTQQAADTANYGQYQAQQAFPYQQAQFLEQYGLPSALAQGSTSNGTQTSPGPNTGAQVAGLGIAAAGMFLKDGGSVDGYAPGGGVGYVTSPLGYIDSGQGYIPTRSGPSQNTLQAPALKFAQTSTANPFQSSITGLNGMKGDFAGEAYGGGNALTDSYGGSSSSPLEGLSASDYGAGFNVGGLVHAIHAIHKTIKRSRGGAVDSSAPFARFDDGGDVSFNDRFAPAQDNPFGDMSRGQAIKLLSNSREGITAPSSIPGGEPDVINPDQPFRLDPAATDAWRAGVDKPNPAVMADAGMPDSSNPMTNRLPPQITNPDNAPEPESPALAYDSGSTAGPMGANGMPTIIAPTHSDEQHFGHSLFGANISDKTRQAMVAAGLGIMASRSPFALSALGEGGLRGLQSYGESSKLEQEAANQAATKAQEQQRIDLQAKQLAQSASQFQDKTPPGYRQKDDGSYEAIPGGPADISTLKAQADAKRGTGMSDLAVDIKARQMANGDLSGLTNIGRGAQAGQTLERIANRAAEIRVQENGETPEEAAQNMSKALQEFKAAGIGKSAEARTAATREANLNLILKATDAAIPAALEASKNVARTGWVPINKIIQGGQVMASSPELKEFGMANLQLAEHWARAMNPTGVMRESDRDKALSFLSTADSPATYERAVRQLQKQITRERDAVRGVTGGSTQFPAPGAANVTPGGAAPSEQVTKTINGKPYVNRNGQWFEQ